MSKPNWDDAPDWAMWLLKHHGGYWWCENPPMGGDMFGPGKCVEAGMYTTGVSEAPEPRPDFEMVEYTPEDEYVIHSHSERGFWSNEQGWVGDIDDATRFGASELGNLPQSSESDAKWIQVSYVD